MPDRQKRRRPRSGARRPTGRRARSKPGRRRTAGAPTGPPPIEYSILLTATLMLLAFGAVMVFSASSTQSILADGGISGSVSNLTMTLLAGSVGLVLMFLASRTPLERIRELTGAILIGTFVLLLVVLAIGDAVNGTRGWLQFGPVQVQPAEFLKLALVLYGAYLFADRPERLSSLREMGPYLAVTAGACFLVILQPDLGSVIIAGVAAGLTLWVAGARPRDLALLAIPGSMAAFLFAMSSSERRGRLLTFLDPAADPGGAGYQVIQAKIAIGSGGLGGVGIGDSVQKALYLPEAHTDMILAVIGEEVGLIGVLILVGTFFAIAFAGFRIAREARDDYGRIVAGGLTGVIIFQAILNMYAVMGIAPLTGVPLPFVSYGNNSLVVFLIAIGLLLNIARGGSLARSGTARPGAGAKLRLIQGERARTQRKRAVGSAQSADRGRRHGGTRRARPRRG